MIQPQSLDKYRFLRALRPFSFPVAIIACLIGVLAAREEGIWQPYLVILILSAGILLQAGVNLINDHTDLTLLQGDSLELQRARSQVHRNFNIGMLCFLAAAAIGLYLIIHAGITLLIISALGLLGALGYTLAPINYKNRGLGVVMVFWLMGVLMITGSYLAAGASFSAKIVWLSLPVSFLIALVLLSNELRDYEQDQRDGLCTLTVRLGYRFSIWLYFALIVAALLSSWWLQLMGYLTVVWPVLLTVLLTIKPVRLLFATAEHRKQITPATARFLLAFGLVFCGLLIV